MKMREFMSLARRSLDFFEQAQGNEGVDPDDDIDASDMVEQLVDHLNCDARLEEDSDEEAGDDPEDDEPPSDDDGA